MFKKVIGRRPDEVPEAPAAAPASTPPSVSAPAAGSPPSPVSAPASKPAAPAGPSRNVLSTDVDIKGTVKFTNDLVVDGKIEGEIASSGNLTVGENARLKAEIKCGTVVVYGKVHGNIAASDRVDLKSSAEVVGDIKAKTLAIEAGAIFVGKSTVGTPSTPAASEPKKDDKPANAPAKA
ncbi:hypothetical protein Hsar01_03876 [Haloferula sargassicola]|uniref:Polymer-forming cytoskeletal protein n=2 Tax=Haloferula sargassicola TaxID=490096 RepID=A0ABP9UTR9_9BACT